MLSHSKSVMSSDSDDDYELPSLSERIKASSLTFQNRKVLHHDSTESEDEESSFLKFSERIRNTPCSQVKFNEKVTYAETEEPKIFKSVRKNNPAPLNIKLDFSATSESEDEESVFLSFSQRVQSTPQMTALGSCYITSESDSDEVFSNLSERLKMMTPRTETKYVSTPRTENKENCSTADGSNAKKSEFHTPLSPQKKIPYIAVDSESDESFSNFIEILKTPMSINRKVPRKTVDSESDESFSNFVERLRTPLSVRNQKDVIALPKITEMRQFCSPLFSKDTPKSFEKRKSENEKEFEMLFQPESVKSTFLKKRDLYTRMLYEFYNKKVFNSRLPPDMPLVYDGALKTTAGLTYCSVKNNTYMCSIKLSSSLLNSFDHLRETLLHEMCHVAVWIVNKQHKVKHGPLWQVWASRCKLILPFIKCPTRCHNYEIAYSVWYQCPKCQWKKGRCKQVRKYHGALCRRCRTPITVTYK